MTLVWAGLSLGAVYALVAVGYSLVFSASGVFNFAQAQLMMVGVFVSYWVLVTLELPVFMAFLIAAAVVGTAAALEERIAVRPVGDSHTWLVTTLGAAVVLDGVTRALWGAQVRTVPFFLDGSTLSLLGGRVDREEVALIGMAVVLVAVLWLLLRFTLPGLAVLAVAEDREAAMLKGIPVGRVIAGSFVVAGAIAGLMGPIVGPKTFAVSTLGTALALKGFVALAIGGFGSLPGALIGGMTVGVVEQLAVFQWGAVYANTAVFALLLAVLMLRPTGLFGTLKERVV